LLKMPKDCPNSLVHWIINNMRILKKMLLTQGIARYNKSVSIQIPWTYKHNIQSTDIIPQEDGFHRKVCHNQEICQSMKGLPFFEICVGMKRLPFFLMHTGNLSKWGALMDSYLITKTTGLINVLQFLAFKTCIINSQALWSFNPNSAANDIPCAQCKIVL
jgi:hypothetical protein